MSVVTSVRWMAVFALCLGCALAEEAAAYEQRTNTVSLGIQGGVGLMNGSGSYDSDLTSEDLLLPYDGYDLGPGLSLNIRYSLDRRHAIGISFEDLRFDRKPGVVAEPTQYQLNNFTFHYFTYFARREKLSRYIGLGAGFHRPAFRIKDFENVLPGEGFTANLSGGLEYFLRRPLSIDACVKGYYMKPKQGTIVAGELFVGIQYYLLN